MKTNLISKIKEKLQIKFVKNFLTLFSGSVMGEAIMFAFTPLLTRLYPETVFGLFFIYSALSQILRIIATLRFEIALVLPKKDSHAINLLVVAFITNLIINLLFLGFIYLLYDLVVLYSGDKSLGIWFYVIPLSSFLLANFEILSAWNNRTENYKNISYGRISKSVFSGSMQTGFSLTSMHQFGLFIGIIIGQFVSFITIASLSFKSIFLNLKYLSKKRSLALIRKYQDVPIYNTSLAVISVLSQHLPTLMFGYLFGLEIAAMYGMAVRVIASPVGLIADAVGKVFYKTATDIVNQDKNLYSFVKKSFFNLGRIAIPLFVLVFLVSFFLDDIFGEAWGRAGLYTRIMMPWLFLSFLHNPVSWIITVLKKQKILTIANIALVIMRFFAIYIVWILKGSPTSSLIAFTFVSFIYSSFIIVFIIKISQKKSNTY